MSDLKLKIKRITLAAEARGIKINQNRLKRRLKKLLAKQFGDPTNKANVISRGWLQWSSLDSHRKNEVRNEARAMHLACNFLRDRDYAAIEAITRWDGMDDKREMRDISMFEKQWNKIWERVRYHVERHIPLTTDEIRSKRLQEFAEWHDTAKAYAASAEAQKPALEKARAGSIAAADKRRQAYEKAKLAKE